MIEKILNCKSLSIVGLEKNTGKTECLNYILGGIRNSDRQVAITSIGVDGEACDQLTFTAKPEIRVYEGMWFVTSEKHYREKRLTSEIIEVSEQHTALGRLVTGRAVNTGKVILSGPSDIGSMKELIVALQQRGMDLVIVDGALSRLSLGAPTVTEAIVLATGAAVSGNIRQLVQKTKYVYDLICLEEAGREERKLCERADRGIWAIGKNNSVVDLGIPSSFLFDGTKGDIFRQGGRFFISGAVGDRFLNFMRVQKMPVELIIRDFTRVFASPEVFYAFIQSGKKLRVLNRSRLLAICVNPQSPDGYLLDSELLCEALRREVEVPVIDVRKTGENDAV